MSVLITFFYEFDVDNDKNTVLMLCLPRRNDRFVFSVYYFVAKGSVAENTVDSLSLPIIAAVLN